MTQVNVVPIRRYDLLIGLSFAEILTRIIVLLIAMSVHEFAHAYVAYLAGDNTAADQGRLTLNPLVHIHWIGFLMFVFIGFGILGSAPVDARRMRNPRWGHLAAVAAGPLSNLFLAIVAAVIVRIMGLSVSTRIVSDWLPTMPELIAGFIFWNVLLFVFNILPFFPMDGWQIVRDLLPIPSRYKWERHAQTSQYILLGLIMLSFILPGSFNVLALLIGVPTRTILSALLG